MNREQVERMRNEYYQMQLNLMQIVSRVADNENATADEINAAANIANAVTIATFG